MMCHLSSTFCLCLKRKPARLIQCLRFNVHGCDLYGYQQLLIGPSSCINGENCDVQGKVFWDVFFMGLFTCPGTHSYLNLLNQSLLDQLIIITIMG